MEAIFNEILIPLVPIIAGFLTTVFSKYVLTGYQTLFGKIEADVIKQVVVVVVGFAVTKLGAFFGVQLPLDPTTWTADVINTLMVAVTSFGLHNLYKTIKKDEAPAEPAA